MKTTTPATGYSVDTCSFMDWQARFYPTDVFPGLLARIDGLISGGLLRSPELVREELGAVGTPGLIDWAKSRSGLFIPTIEVLSVAQDVQNRFPDLRDPKAEYEEADAYVIALAKIRGWTVVTQETAAAEKTKRKRTHYMPDVCRELGIPCISMLGLMRREGWQF